MIKRVAVVEDSDIEAEKLRGYCARYQTGKDLSFDITRFSSAERFLDQYDGTFDIVFMDIMLSGMNGMAASQRLRKLDPLVTLVFVTNMAQFAVKGYEVDALDFIVKPVLYPHFVMKMDRILAKLQNDVHKDIVLRSGDTMLRVPMDAITYVEVSAHQLVYHTADGKRIEVYGTLKKAEEELDDSFVRCNSCYLVNLKRVESVSGGMARVGGDELQISRAKHKKFLEALDNYLAVNL
jgi:two-component system response regulator LytT